MMNRWVINNVVMIDVMILIFSVVVKFCIGLELMNYKMVVVINVVMFVFRIVDSVCL